MTKLAITTNKRNCLTKMYLDNKVMEVGSIRLFATVIAHFKPKSHTP